MNDLYNLNFSDFSVQILPVGEKGPIYYNNVIQIEDVYSHDGNYNEAVENYFNLKIKGLNNMDKFLHDIENDTNLYRGLYRGLYIGLYYWLIYSGPNTYDLVSFETPEFIQGFISICRAFQVDFTDYVLGDPFMYHENTKIPTYYSIELYRIIRRYFCIFMIHEWIP